MAFTFLSAAHVFANTVTNNHQVSLSSLVIICRTMRCERLIVYSTQLHIGDFRRTVDTVGRIWVVVLLPIRLDGLRDVVSPHGGMGRGAAENRI